MYHRIQTTALVQIVFPSPETLRIRPMIPDIFWHHQNSLVIHCSEPLSLYWFVYPSIASCFSPRLSYHPLELPQPPLLLSLMASILPRLTVWFDFLPLGFSSRMPEVASFVIFYTFSTTGNHTACLVLEYSESFLFKFCPAASSSFTRSSFSSL